MHVHRTLIAAALLAQSALAGGTLQVPSQFPTIQAAIDAAQPGDTVLVAAGVYSGVGNRDINLNGKDIVVRSADGAATCIIDCDGSFHNPHRGFLIENNETRAAVISGFTIQNASTLDGAVADEFNGAGIRVRNGASPTIKHCIFRENTAGCWGGGVYAGFGGTPLIIGCTFDNNSADDGAGLFTWNGSITEVRSSVFIRNRADNLGGAIADFGGGAMHLDNCTIVENVAAHWSTGGVVDFGNGTTIQSSIIWGNSGDQQIMSNAITVEHSAVQGGFVGNGNTSANPMFAADGFHLRPDSPCVNAGSEDYMPMRGETDIDGSRRILGERVDIGADEMTRNGSWIPELFGFGRLFPANG